MHDLGVLETLTSRYSDFDGYWIQGLIVDDLDAATYVHHACSGCGTVWDQDENAAAVLLARRRERPGDEQIAGDAHGECNASTFAAQRESRWARARRTATEKRAKVHAVRKATGNGSQ